MYRTESTMKPCWLRKYVFLITSNTKTCAGACAHMCTHVHVHAHTHTHTHTHTETNRWSTLTIIHLGSQWKAKYFYILIHCHSCPALCPCMHACNGLFPPLPSAGEGCTHFCFVAHCRGRWWGEGGAQSWVVTLLWKFEFSVALRPQRP